MVTSALKGTVFFCQQIRNQENIGHIQRRMRGRLLKLTKEMERP
jgi:hypothetical protein